LQNPSRQDQLAAVQLLGFKGYKPFRSSGVIVLRFKTHQLVSQWDVFLMLMGRGGVRSTQGLGPNMTAWGQSIGISNGMLPQTLIMSRLDQHLRLGARI
jgi:hypothetical protein